MKKIILINIIIAFFCLCILEFLSTIIIYNSYYKKFSFDTFFDEMAYKKSFNITNNNIPYNFRPIEYRDIHKRPIILFGCSFTWGHGLEDNETFSKQLADYTGRTVVNRGIQGTGTSFIYFQASDDTILKNIKNSIIPPYINDADKKNVNTDVEYIIYTFISGHPIRNFAYKPNLFCPHFNIRYDLKDNKLVRHNIKWEFLHSSHFFTLIYNYIYCRKRITQEYNYLVFKRELEDSIKLLQNFYPNSKMIILIWPDLQYEPINKDLVKYLYFLESNMFKGKVKVIDIESLIPDLRTDKYWTQRHPSAYSWEKIIPLIDKELNIK